MRAIGASLLSARQRYAARQRRPAQGCPAHTPLAVASSLLPPPSPSAPLPLSRGARRPPSSRSPRAPLLSARSPSPPPSPSPSHRLASPPAPLPAGRCTALASGAATRALSPLPPPPPLGPTDAPRLRPPPAAMSRGAWRRLERAAARRGRRSGAEGRAPVSGAGGPPVGRGGRRGAAGPAQRCEGPRRGRPGPVHRGGAAGCGAARSVCRPPRSRSPSPGSAGPKSIRFGCVWLCLQSVCAFPSQNVAFGSHLHPSPIPFGFGANRYDWGRSFPSVSAPRLVMVSPNQSGALRRTT